MTLKLAARKLRADEQGNEKEIPLDEEIDVGAVDAEGKPLLLERRRLKAGEQTVTLLVPGKPAKAGVDPLNKLIDRKPDDNLTAVDMDAAAAPALPLIPYNPEWRRPGPSFTSTWTRSTRRSSSGTILTWPASQ